MGFGEAIRSGLSNYFAFRGRASRSEYWYFVLFIVICALPAVLVDLAIGRTIFQVIVALATFIPHVSAIVRRLHDIGRSGWFYWIAMVPLVGVVILIYWLCKAGTTQPNQYGEARTWSIDPSSDAGRDEATAGVWLTATFQSASVEVDNARPVLRIGRGHGNDLVVADMLASGNHARIECRGDQFFLKDLSSNGTYVCLHGRQEVSLVGKEIPLEGSGLIGLGRSTVTDPELCIRFAIQRRR
jgi:uncharacterized membrane protein YhaH (DUF805 family)